MRRLIGLQYLRGIAALGVVAYHAADRSGLAFPVGKAGVDLFFVLSGFLMWAITDEHSRPGPFLVDRFKRILPCYWIATSVMLAGALLGLFPAIQLTVGHVLASFLLLPAISPSNGHPWPLLVPGWTLEYEAAFYLLFGIALLAPRRFQLGLLSAVLLALPLAHIWISRDRTMASFYTDARLLEFLSGLWLAQMWRHGLLAKVSAAPWLIGSASLLLIGTPSLISGAPDVLLYGPPALLVVAAMLAWESRAGGVPVIGPVALLGDASYSIYLWHTLAISVTAKIAEILGMPVAAAVMLHLICGVAIGLLAYAVIERPILAALKRPKYRRYVPVPGGV